MYIQGTQNIYIKIKVSTLNFTLQELSFDRQAKLHIPCRVSATTYTNKQNSTWTNDTKKNFSNN